jgi:DNA topoisomerase IB
MLELSASEAIVDAKDAAEYAGLIYVSDEKPGIQRKRSGKGFRYESGSGQRIKDLPTLKRIKALAVPPAWTDVWICGKANGHIQATGRDARGRKQYRYHTRFREVREGTKYHHMLAFAESLPAIRRKVQEHLALRGLPREKVVATVVHLLEATLIRVGSDEYARSNKSYGLTTLKNRHVEVEGSALKFNFKGKSGKVWKLNIRNRRVAKVIRACQELPTCARSAARTSRPRILERGTARCSLPWRCRSSRNSTATLAPSEISATPSRRWRRGSATPRPFAANAISTPRSSRPTSRARCCSRPRTESKWS